MRELNWRERLALRAAALWRKIPVPLRAGLVAAVMTFVGTTLSIIVGILPVLAEAFLTGNYTSFFDHLSLAGAALISAMGAFGAGLVNAVWRWARPIADAYRTDPPG